MKRLSLYLPDEMYEQIRKEAFDLHVPMNDLIINNLVLKKTHLDHPSVVSTKGERKTIPATPEIQNIKFIPVPK